MDPVSHVILSGTMVAALETPRCSRFGRGAVPAVVLGALAPDVDCVLMPVGWDVYLRFHEIGTHSLAGAVVLGGAVAALVRVLVRGSRMKGLGAAATAIASAVAHPVLDMLSGARVAMFWPLANARTSWPLVAMGDPWLIALLTTGLVAVWVGRRELSRTARTVLLVVAVFFGLKSSLYTAVRRAAESGDPHPREASRVLKARWGSWTEWFVFDKSSNTLRGRIVNGWTGTRTLVLSWPADSAPPLADASRTLDTVRNFLSVHDLAFAVEQVDGHGRRVRWSDVRYCWQAAPGKGPPDCGLWFGGTFDASGQAIMQTVQVGAWTQTRPVSP